jgi:hypothetical protein
MTASRCKLRFALERRALEDGTPWPDTDVESMWGELLDETHAIVSQPVVYERAALVA